MRKLLVIFVAIVGVTLAYAQEENSKVIYVTVSEENLRLSPNGQKIGTILHGVKLEQLEQEGKWTKVRIEGWIWTPSVSEEKPPPEKKTEGPLKFDIIKTSALGNTMVEVKVKIINNTDKYIHNAQVACILLDSNSQEIAFQKHYAIKSTEGGLAPHKSTHFTYVVDANYSHVKYVSFQIEELNFR
jgi:hypothetical protein